MSNGKMISQSILRIFTLYLRRGGLRRPCIWLLHFLDACDDHHSGSYRERVKRTHSGLLLPVGGIQGKRGRGSGTLQ